MDSGLKYGLIMLTHAYTLKPRSKVVDDIPIEMHIDYRRMCVCAYYNNNNNKYNKYNKYNK